MRDELTNLRIKIESLKDSHKKIPIHPIIGFRHIQFEQEAFLLTGLKRVDDNGVKGLSPRNKANPLRGNDQVKNVEDS